MVTQFSLDRVSKHQISFRCKVFTKHFATLVVILEMSVTKYVRHRRLHSCRLHLSTAHSGENCVHPLTLLNIMLSTLSTVFFVFTPTPFCESSAECLNQHHLVLLTLSFNQGVCEVILSCAGFTEA